jgi:hypothetical protein
MKKKSARIDLSAAHYARTRRGPTSEWGTSDYVRSTPCANPECVGSVRHSGWTVAWDDGCLLYLCDTGALLRLVGATGAVITRRKYE